MAASINDLYNGAFILLVLVAIYIFTHPPDEPMDLNGDGKIDQMEIEEYIKRQVEKHTKKKLDLRAMLRSSATGAIRGFLMGLVLGSFEGACVTAITLGLINPILARLEYHI